MISILLSSSCCILILIYFLITECIELSLVLIFHFIVYILCIILIMISPIVFFLPLCITNPVCTYFIVRYYNFVGFKWSRLMNSFCIYPVNIIKIILSPIEKILEIEKIKVY